MNLPYTCRMESAQRALDQGADLSGLDWITIADGMVIDLDFEKYVEYATRMKTPPAFDSLDARSWENTLFGTAAVDARHFTSYSQEHSTVDATLADSMQVKMMNPMNYIGTKKTATARYWRIRHGTIDRDTSLAVPVILATELQNKGYDVDFAMPWNVPHSGDYDLNELFDWIGQVSSFKK